VAAEAKIEKGRPGLQRLEEAFLALDDVTGQPRQPIARQGDRRLGDGSGMAVAWRRDQARSASLPYSASVT
jgi:hypothetical protein